MKRTPMPALDTAAFAHVAVPQPDPVQVAASTKRVKKGGEPQSTKPSKRTTQQQASRVGKVQVQAWVTLDVRRRLKSFAANTDSTIEQLLAQAIDELLRKAAK